MSGASVSLVRRQSRDLQFSGFQTFSMRRASADDYIHSLSFDLISGHVYVLTNIFNCLLCIEIAATMHEIGHTMGLTHANENGQPYADFSGYMAAGYKDTDWPRKCFNGHKVRI
jgi:hypothetical protein